MATGGDRDGVGQRGARIHGIRVVGVGDRQIGLRDDRARLVRFVARGGEAVVVRIPRVARDPAVAPRLGHRHRARGVGPVAGDRRAAGGGAVGAGPRVGGGVQGPAEHEGDRTARIHPARERRHVLDRLAGGGGRGGARGERRRRLVHRARLAFFFNATATTEIYPLSLHDALPILAPRLGHRHRARGVGPVAGDRRAAGGGAVGAGPRHGGTAKTPLDRVPDSTAQIHPARERRHVLDRLAGGGGRGGARGERRRRLVHRARLARFFFNDTAPTEIYTLSLPDALPVSPRLGHRHRARGVGPVAGDRRAAGGGAV